MNIEIKKQLVIDVENTKLANLQPLLKTLTYINPEYLSREHLGFSTYNIPRTIKQWWFNESKSKLTLPRGTLNIAQTLLKDVSITDKTVLAPLQDDLIYHNPEFNLDKLQSRAINKLLQYNQGLILATTSAGKTAMFLNIISKLNNKTLIIVNRRLLAEQIFIDAKKYLKYKNNKDVDIGIIGGGKKKLHDITICIDKTMQKMLEKDKGVFDDYGLVIQDECHTATTTTMQNILNSLPARYRYGFTGTIKRKDKKEFIVYNLFGDIKDTITKEELGDLNRVTSVDVDVIYSETALLEDVSELSQGDLYKKMIETINNDANRYSLVIKKVKELLLDRNKKILIVSNNVKPVIKFYDELIALGIPVNFITGDTKNQQEITAQFERGDFRVLIATTPIISTGVNIPSLTDLILWSPIYTNEALLLQLRGRLMRKHKDKDKGTFWCVYDPLLFKPYKLKNLTNIIKNK